MKIFKCFACQLTIIAILIAACNSGSQKGKESQVAEKSETILYSADTINMKGFIAFPKMMENEKRPAILIIHEWWGLNEYPKSRAKQLADLGYVSMAVDMYGNGKIVETPDEAEKLATPFYFNPQIAKQRFEAALVKLKTLPQVDTSNIAAIGYCFGGAQVINMANMGLPLKGVVCFHGNVMPGTIPSKELSKIKVLVCNGAADSYVPADEINLYKKKMDSVGASYTIKLYDSAVHAFTNPKATETGMKYKLQIKYNAAADSASWNDMKVFLFDVFK